MTAQLELSLESKRNNLQRVLENAGHQWQVLARLVVRTMANQEVTGEDIRLRCLSLDIEPHHHNAWGAFISMLVTEGRLIPTGRYVAMKSERSNARKTQVYRVGAG